MHKIVAIGGTGQDVLQLYVLAYLCGAVKEPFHAVVLDADALRPGLRMLRDFLDVVVMDPESRGTFGVEVPAITYHRVRPQGTRVDEVLLGYKPGDELTAADAFFDRENLAQSIDKGLFARPALSSALSASLIDERLLLPDPEGRVFVVGSVLGGTGGGLLARVIDATYRVAVAAGRTPKIRGVLFGEWFEPSRGLIDRTRMRSNLYMVLHALSEGAQNLHSYAIVDAVDGRLVQDRVPMDVIHLPLPDSEAHPLWRGVNALEWLRRDEVMAAESRFEKREKDVQPFLRLERVRDSLSRAAGACDAISSESLPALIVGEPWRKRVWGEPLVAFNSRLLGVARKHAETTATSGDPRTLSLGIRKLWSGSNAEPGLTALMSSATPRPHPDYFRQLRWPVGGSFANTLHEVPRRVAANYVFHCMRETLV